MSAMYWLRVVMMAAILAGVIWTMRFLNGPGHGSGTAVNFSPCPTRVSWIETTADNLHIEQKGGKWTRIINGNTAELEPIPVEKWFSQFCTAAMDSTSEGTDFKPIMRVGYISGKPELLLRSATGEFQLMQHNFKSKDLTEALRTLPSLPTAGETTR